MLIKTIKDKIDVNINIRNSKDNAYNTRVILSFSPNINYMKAEVRRLASNDLSFNDSDFFFAVVMCVFYFYSVSRIWTAI